MNKILIVAAHPDDEVLGCFATVAKMIQNGDEAYCLILGAGKTSRGPVQHSEIDDLHDEMLAAHKVIGIKETFCCDYPDNAMDTVSLLSIVKDILKVKEKVQPNIIFTHHIGDLNIDHQITHQAVLTATRPMEDECVKAIYSMEVPSSTEWNSFNRETAFVPNVFVDVSKTIDLKVEAMNQYHSELREYPHPRSLQYIKDSAKLYGTQVGVQFVERFFCIRNIVY